MLVGLRARLSLLVLATGLSSVPAGAQEGALDPSFGDGGRVFLALGRSHTDAPKAVAALPDGRLLVAFTTSGTFERVALARYRADGTLDPTFGEGGVVVTPGLINARANAMAVHPDGRIVVVGYVAVEGGFSTYGYASMLAVRYLPDGAIDRTFGTEGISTVGFGNTFASANAVTLQPDGRIVIAGRVRRNNPFHSAFAVVWLNAYGNPDLPFAFTPAGGVAVHDTAFAVALQPDGRIVVAGARRSSNVDVPSALMLARFTADGSLDGSFGSGGVVLTDVGPGAEEARGVTVQPDGRIVVVGWGTGAVGDDPDVLVAGYTPSGSLDSTFGTAGGIVTLPVTDGRDGAHAVTLVRDGKILVAGHAERADGTLQAALLRFTPDGHLDGTFGEGGVATMGFGTNGRAVGVTLTDDGRIAIAGPARIGFYPHIALARFSADGAPDPTFGDGGLVTTLGAGPGPMTAEGLVLQPDGRIVVVGTANSGRDTDFVTARFLPDGRLDPSFGEGGAVWTTPPAQGYFAGAVVVQPDGRIVIGGTTYEYVNNVPAGPFTLVRYLPDGRLDPMFGTGGIATPVFPNTTPESWAFLENVALQPDGHILASGSLIRSLFGPRVEVLARYTQDGRLDSTFGSDGLVILSGGGRGLAVQPDSQILVSGDSPFAVARYNADGSLDVTFGAGGIASITGTPFHQGWLNALTVLPDGRIVGAGACTRSGEQEEMVVVRYTSDGVGDPSFGALGVVDVPFHSPAYEEWANSVVVQPDGRPVAAGFTQEAGGNPYDSAFSLARLTTSGALDPTFGEGGRVETSFNSDWNVSERAYGLTLQPDGKLVAVGSGRDGEKGITLVRYLAGGTTATAPEASPSSVTLSVAPNPVRGVAAVRFELPAAAAVRLAAYDALGREVAVLAEGLHAEGAHQVVLAPGSLPAGAYILRLETGERHVVRRLTVIR